MACKGRFLSLSDHCLQSKTWKWTKSSFVLFNFQETKCWKLTSFTQSLEMLSCSLTTVDNSYVGCWWETKGWNSLQAETVSWRAVSEMPPCQPSVSRLSLCFVETITVQSQYLSPTPAVQSQPRNWRLCWHNKSHNVIQTNCAALHKHKWFNHILILADGSRRNI